jgi:hypothetical protein
VRDLVGGGGGGVTAGPKKKGNRQRREQITLTKLPETLLLQDVDIGNFTFRLIFLTHTKWTSEPCKYSLALHNVISDNDGGPIRSNIIIQSYNI